MSLEIINGRRIVEKNPNKEFLDAAYSLFVGLKAVDTETREEVISDLYKTPVSLKNKIYMDIVAHGCLKMDLKTKLLRWWINFRFDFKIDEVAQFMLMILPSAPSLYKEYDLILDGMKKKYGDPTQISLMYFAMKHGWYPTKDTLDYCSDAVDAITTGLIRLEELLPEKKNEKNL